MYLREAKADELDAIYDMGFETWHEGMTYDEYLAECRGNDKYQAGTWYVLIENEQVVSSLIVYSRMFDLEDSCFGIGSVATPKSERGKGYASYLVKLVTDELFANHNCNFLFLHSDIDHKFYARLGFETIEGSNCMYISKDSSKFSGSTPRYF